MINAQPCELRARFISGMGRAACTVNIISTDGPAGRAGVTVSAMSSVSADGSKPTLLACIHYQSPAVAKIIGNDCFCVNVLRDDQAYMSDVFAGRHKDMLDNKFDCAEWVDMPSGAPRVLDSLVSFDCQLAFSERVGTHYVFFGAVNDVFISETGSPLIYTRSRYRAATPITKRTSPEEVDDAELRIGCCHGVGASILPPLIEQLAESRPELAITIVDGDERRLEDDLAIGSIHVALTRELDRGTGRSGVRLADLSLHALIAARHPLANKPALEADDLVKIPMVALTTPIDSVLMRSVFAATAMPQIACQSTNIEMVHNLVMRNAGFSILALPPNAIAAYRQVGLACRPLVGIRNQPRVTLTLQSQSAKHGPTDEFDDLCRTSFGIDHM